MSQHRIVFVTCPPAAAEALAERLLEQGLAACVNCVPGLRSMYRWRGEIQHDDETLLLIKTDVAHVDALREAVLAAHPHELPEFVAVQIDAHPPYLKWISDSLA